MIRLIAKAPYVYGGRRLKSGDEFDASEKDAKLLTLVGKASQAAEPKKAAKAPPKKKAKGEYVRRDMRAAG